MLESLISQNEGKTLEFKENTTPLASIVKTVIAFANTPGGNIIIGICDKNKKIVGIEKSLLEKSTYIRLGSTNRLADSQTILSLQMLAKNISFDELPCVGASKQ